MNDNIRTIYLDYKLSIMEIEDSKEIYKTTLTYISSNNQKYDITIKNLNVESPIESYQIRVDRASILGNPYKMKNKNDDKERDEVCDKYEQYFIEQIKKGNELFAKEFLRLIEIFKKYNKLELFCWCAPKRCHAETLKKYIEIYLNKNNDNNNNNCKENNASCVVSSGETSTQEVLDNKKKEENNMKIIVHQVNCKGVMGAGFAKQVREAFPKCYEEYKNLCNKSSDLLGTYSIYKVNDILAIANIFGQYNYGVRAVYTNYEAFNNAFKKLRKDYPNAEIIAPYNIGCGLAGGDWEVVKPILDKYNIKTSKNIDLYNLSNNKTSNLIKNEIINNLAIGDIEFVDLTPSMFKGNNYILNKYFHYKDHSLDRPYLPELTKEEYENYVKTWGFKNEANRKYETATDYFKNMVKKQLVAKDLGIKNYKKLSFKGYKGNPENFEFSNYADNQRWLFEEKYIEDMFDPDRNLELNLDRKNSPYIIGDYKNEINEAWQFLTLCIRGRLVMLLNLENLIFTINNFIKNTDGLTSNCSNSQIEQLTNPIKNALKMLKDKELNAWIKQGNNDMTLYGINGDENTRKDYIETYQKILRAMLNIKPNESLEYFKDVFHYTNKYYPNLKDKYENIILRNEGLEMENLWDSQSADYDEDNEESIVDNPEYYENVLLNN